MKKILGIGNALVDILTFIDNDSVLDKLELPKGSMQLVDGIKSKAVKDATSHFPRSKASGGSAANTIHGLAMLGTETGFIGSVGKDETGDFFENDLKAAGIKTMLLRRDTVTGTAAAFITPDSERTFATHLGAAVELDAGDLDPALFNDFDILYLEGYLIFNKPLVERACSIAKEKNMKVALDLASYNVVEARIDDFTDIITRYADIVFANEEEAKSYTGLEPEEALHLISEQCEIAVVKVGKDGSWIKRGDEVLKVGALKTKSIDTTGAGDLYASGFLYGLAGNQPLDNCGTLGSYLAGRVIGITGARLNDQTWDEIRSRSTSLFSGLVI
jgi:sugar/nucleoside kinase (ribokinase family)